MDESRTRPPELPRRAWVTSRAYGAGAAWVRRVGALVLAVVAHRLPALVLAKVGGRVLRLGPHVSRGSVPASVPLAAARDGSRWLRAVVLYLVGVVLVVGAFRLPPDAEAAVQLAAVAVFVYALRAAVSYRPLRGEELDALRGLQLYHYSSAAPADLVQASGTVVLDRARCRRTALLWRSDRPWTLTRAVYCFVGPPHPNVIKHNVHADRQHTLVVIEARDVQSPIFIRGDGCVALPHGYSGPAQVIPRR